MTAAAAPSQRSCPWPVQALPHTNQPWPVVANGEPLEALPNLGEAHWEAAARAGSFAGAVSLGHL